MKAQIVSFHCVLKDKLGKVLSTSFNQDVINQNEDHNSDNLRGLVAGLQNVQRGEKRTFSVEASDAYGLYNPDLLIEVSRSELARGKTLTIGSEIISQLSGSNSQRIYRVTQIKGDRLVLDGNHPLAGQDLTFDIEVTSAREASLDDFEEELEENSKRILH